MSRPAPQLPSLPLPAEAHLAYAPSLASGVSATSRAHDSRASTRGSHALASHPSGGSLSARPASTPLRSRRLKKDDGGRPSVVRAATHFHMENALRYAVGDEAHTRPATRARGSAASTRPGTRQAEEKENDPSRPPRTAASSSRQGRNFGSFSDTHTYIASRPPNNVDLTRAHSVDVEVDLLRNAGATPLPACLDPRNLVQRSRARAAAELAWVHSGVFAPVTRTPLVARLSQGATVPRPQTIDDLEPTASAFPPPPLPATLQARQIRDEEDWASDDGNDDESAYYRHDRPAMSSSSPHPASSATSVVSGVWHPAPPAVLDNTRPSPADRLASYDASYSSHLAARDSAVIEADQRRIQTEYEAKRDAARRAASPTRKAATKPAKSHASTKVAGQDALKNVDHTESLANDPSTAAAAAAAAASAESSIAPSSPSAARAKPPPLFRMHSQFATLDPTFDDGIDVVNLPLAFQLPASSHDQASAGRTAPTATTSPSPPTRPTPLALPIGPPSSLAATNVAPALLSPSVVLPLSPDAHREALHLLLETSDLRTTDDSGVDIEQAAALDAFKASRAAAQGVLDRFDAYRAKEVAREAVKTADETAAAAAVRHASDEDTVDEPTNEDEANEPMVRQEVPTPISPRYIRTPASASTFFRASPTPPQHDETADATIAPAASHRTNDAADAAPVESRSITSSGPPSLGTSPLVSVRRIASGAGMAGGGRDALIKMASLRTTGWGSHLARAEGHRPNAHPHSHAHGQHYPPPTPRRAKTIDRTHVGARAAPPSVQAPLEQHAVITSVPIDEVPSSAPDASGSTNSGTLFARPSSGLSQRSWGNRIKRAGMGESAGRGSDARVLIGTTTIDAIARAASSSIDHDSEDDADREAREFERERRLAAEELERDEQEAALTMAAAAHGSLGSASPWHARSIINPNDDDADIVSGGRTMLPDPVRAHSQPQPQQPALQALLVDGSTAAAAMPTTTADLTTLIASMPSATVATQQLVIDTPHYMRQIDRSVTRATRRAARLEAAEKEAAAGARAAGSGDEDDDGGEGVSLSPSSSASSRASVFPRWLWGRKDFQSTYRAVPWETCLRVLHLFPDERTELHLAKLREWILGRAVHGALPHATTHSSEKHHTRGSIDADSAPPPSGSRAVSRSASRAVSRNPSRSALHAAHGSSGGGAQAFATSSTSSLPVVTLPPSGQDYLASLPRPVLDGVLRVIKTTTYAAGEVVWRQGAQGDHFGILVAGRMQIRRVEPIKGATNSQATTQAPAASKPAGLVSRRQSLWVRRDGDASGPQVATNLRAANAGPRSPPSARSSLAGGGGRHVTVQVPLSTRASTRTLSTVSSGVSFGGVSTTSASSAPAPTRQESVQLVLPGAAFGHEREVSDIEEAVSHAAVQRKRTLRLWHLLRLSVRRGMRDEDTALDGPLARITYGGTSGDPSGAASARASGSRGLSEVKTRKETLVALTDCTVFTISFYAFASLAFAYEQSRLRAGVAFLGRVSFFSTLVFSRLRHLYSLLLPRTLKRGDLVWRQGAPADEIAFVEHGTLTMTREVVVTESHRHPVTHTQWRCDETTHVIACRPFAIAESRDFVGEDLVDSSSRCFTVRVRSETARIWLLRKRYAHLLGKHRHRLEDCARVRRAAAAAAVRDALVERYPGHHAAEPFAAVDWATVRAVAVRQGLDPAAAPELHYRGTADLDATGAKEFLFLDAGAIYVRYDPPPPLLKMIAAQEVGSSVKARKADAPHSRRSSLVTGSSLVAPRARRVTRLYTAPSLKHATAAEVASLDLESCFTEHHELTLPSPPPPPPPSHHPVSARSPRPLLSRAATRRVATTAPHTRGDLESPRITTFHEVVTLASQAPSATYVDTE